MSVTARLIILVTAVLAPALLAAIWGVSQAYREQKEAAEQSLRQLTHALAALVEEELAHRANVLLTLAKSPSLELGEIDRFYAFAKTVAPDAERTIVLSDLDGRQLLNTRLPPHSRELPISRNLPDLRERLGLAPDATLVSNAYFAPVGKRFSFAVQVPVVRDGKVTNYLAMGGFSDTLQKLLFDQRLRPGWNASVADRDGVLLARRIDPERFVGKPGTADFLARLNDSPEGLFETVRLDGVPVITSYAPIGSSGWTFAVSMPRSDLQQGLTQALLATSVITLGLFALALLVALAAGRSITRPLRELVQSAAAVGRGEAPPPWRHRLAESRLIAAELERASAQIRAARLDLERRVESAVGDAKRAQEALLQNQKLEALGRLTGGIAHDFNNLLQTISVAMEIVLRQAKDGGMLGAAEAGKRAVQSAVKLTRQLMAFGRGQAASRETIDLRDQAMRLQQLIAGAARGDIELSFEFAGDLWPVTVDVVQLELALLNAALNSRDAMPKGGRLVIGARNAMLTEGNAPGIRAGEYVELTVTDSGQGIPADLRARVFEPFFTTKDVGKGAGLGLAQIHAFATQSGGTATLRSDTAGSGTALSIWLPRAARPPVAAAKATPVNPPSPPARAFTVLLVEDDANVRSVVGPALESAGFRVRLAGDAAAALEAVRRNGRAIDIVFSDIVMPGGKSGVDLALELRRTHPQLPVLLATGYAESAHPPDGVRILAKPYRIDELKAALVAALRT